MNRLAVKLPRARLFGLRGKNVEIAIGLIALSILESQRADAAVATTTRGFDPRQPDADRTPDNAQVDQELHAALGNLADVDPSEIKTLSLDELKQLLTPEALASLGLGKGFAQLLDRDPNTALHKLESAFRKKLLAVAHSHSEIASADHVAGDHDHLRADGDHHDFDLSVLGGSALLPILGVVAAGAGVALAVSGGKSDSPSTPAAPVNQAPVNTVANSSVSGTASAPIAVKGITVSDPDSTNLTTTLKVGHGTLSIGQVTGGATVSGAGTGTLVLTGTAAQINASLAALNFTAATGYSGTDSLSIATNDGQLTTTSTLTLNIGQVQAGIVQDGYIKGATVFIDVNGNGKLDDNEKQYSATTDANGNYVLPSAAAGVAGSIVAMGGTNIDTGLPNLAVLKAPPGSSVINPITTLVAALVESGQSVADAKAVVSAALGIPAGVDVTTLDFIAPGAGVSAAQALEIQKSATQIVTLINTGIGAGLDANTVASSIAKMAATNTAAGRSLDLTNTTTLTNILVGSGATTDAANTAASKAAAINDQISKATSIDGLVSVVVTTGGGTSGGTGGTGGGGTTPIPNSPPVAHDDVAVTAKQTAIPINVLANDTDVNFDRLTVTAVNGIAITMTSPVHIDGSGTISLLSDGRLVFTPDAGVTGNVTFNYTVSDGSASSTGSVVVDVHDASVDHTLTITAASEFQGLVDTAHFQAIAHVDTLDVNLTDSTAPHDLSISQGQAQALIAEGIHFVDSNNITMTTGSHLSTTLKGLTDLHVDTVLLSGGALGAEHVVAGMSLSDIAATNLPHFTGVGGANPDITLDLQNGNLAGFAGNFGTLAGNLAAAGIDHLDVLGGGNVTVDYGQVTTLASNNIDFVDFDATHLTNVTMNLGAGLGETVDVAKLDQVHVDHIDIDGAGHVGSASFTDAQAAALVHAGIDFAAEDHTPSRPPAPTCRRRSRI